MQVVNDFMDNIRSIFLKARMKINKISESEPPQQKQMAKYNSQRETIRTDYCQNKPSVTVKLAGINHHIPRSI